MMKLEPLKREYDQLIADGYCVVENVLEADMLNRLWLVTGLVGMGRPV
ncbi:MAG: hypothetical protein O7E52_17560 [Candidatus Poribacteria bacterium]|nr:hypothetical protein [Candidatus Poribacteria bacterium]